MKTIRYSFLWSLSLFLFVGCASTPSNQLAPFPDQSKTVQDPSKGRIYVLRVQKVLGSAVAVPILDSRKQIGTLGPGSYFCWEREPGDVTVSSDASREMGGGIWNLDLTVEAGSVHYILQSFGFANVLRLLDEEKGKRLLRHCKPPQGKAGP